MQASLKPFFEAAVKNVTTFGDTDIFPYPIENHVLHDKSKDVVKLLRKAYSCFDECFVQYPPSHISTLSPVGPYGFRCPPFKGCGILDSCNGDLLVGEELIEIKAGDRSFRARDVRQLLTYCALNHSSHEYALTKVGCANPRRGTKFSIDIETLCIEVSSKPAPELLAEVVYFCSSGDMSH